MSNTQKSDPYDNLSLREKFFYFIMDKWFGLFLGWKYEHLYKPWRYMRIDTWELARAFFLGIILPLLMLVIILCSVLLFIIALINITVPTLIVVGFILLGLIIAYGMSSVTGRE